MKYLELRIEELESTVARLESWLQATREHRDKVATYRDQYLAALVKIVDESREIGVQKEELVAIAKEALNS